MQMTPAEDRLLRIVERGLGSSPAQIPKGFQEGNNPPSVGVPVNGDEYRQNIITKLCEVGDLNCVGVSEDKNMVFLTNRIIPAKDRTPLPWVSAEKEKQMATVAAKKEKAEKAPKPKKEVVMVPCVCGCGEMAKKAFAMHHDGKLASRMKKVGRGEGDANDKAIIKNAFKNSHVSGSAFFQKLHAEMEENLRNPPPKKEKAAKAKSEDDE